MGCEGGWVSSGPLGGNLGSGSLEGPVGEPLWGVFLGRAPKGDDEGTRVAPDLALTLDLYLVLPKEQKGAGDQM